MLQLKDHITIAAITTCGPLPVLCTAQADLVDPEELAAAVAALQVALPGVAVHCADHGAVPLHAVLDVSSDDAAGLWKVGRGHRKPVTKATVPTVVGTHGYCPCCHLL